MSPRLRQLLFWGGVALWALEAFVVQERTFTVPGESIDAGWVLQRLNRLVLGASVATLLALTLHRTLLALFFLLQFVFWNVALMYQGYFRHPISLLDTLGILVDGSAVFPTTDWLIDVPLTLSLGGLLCVKLGLVGQAGERASERLARPLRRRVLARAAMGVLLTVPLGLMLAPAESAEVRGGGVSRQGPAVGYMIPTLWEMSEPRDERLLGRAIEAGRAQTNRLLPVEAPLEVGEHLVIVQVESLDFGVIGFEAGGEPVTPFLNRLKERSMFYKLEAIHIHGSADADFATLMGRMPSPDTVPYYVKGYPYEDSLPRHARRHGYASTAFHGVDGTFFKRRAAYEAMGFERLVFGEEYVEVFGKKRRERLLGVADADVFEVAAREISAAEGPHFAFLITVTSHGPFASLTPEERELFAEPKSLAENYFNSIRYVDRALEAFHEALPEDTTLIVYGDHVSQVKHPGYEPGLEGLKEYVPLFIHHKKSDLSRVQRTRHAPLATEGGLTFLDVSRYLREMIARREAVAAQEGN